MSKPATSDAQTLSNQTRFHLANALTGLRLLLAPLMGWAIVQQFWFIATFSMIVAIVTDVYDGKIARRQNRTSAFGGLFDHGTDAFFVSIGAWALAESSVITSWLWPCIAVAFIQYALDSNALAGHKLRGSLIGRYNGIGYYAIVATAIGALTLEAAIYEFTAQQPESLGMAIDAIALLRHAVYWAAWLLVATTLFSIADRLYRSMWRRARSSSPKPRP